MVKKLIKNKSWWVLGLVLIACLFAYITYVTPLAGDDWGYALNGMKNNPIEMTFSFYQSWSGRFFSELWGFVVAPRKWLWNIINPLLFVIIYGCVYYLGGKKHNPLLSTLMVLAGMLSVNAALRMQTYTWIMGTTYVVPLCLSLVYFCIYDFTFHNSLIETRHHVYMILSNILLFIISMMMENIAATMIVAIVFMIIYAWFNKRVLIKYLIPNLIVAIAGFTLMRISPGSAYRLARDSADWAALSLFEKIAYGYSPFIEQSFLNSRYIISLFSIIMSSDLLLSKEKKVNHIYRIVGILIFAIGTITVFSKILLKPLSFMYDSNSIYSMVLWPIFIINAFVALFVSLKDGYYKNKAIFFLMIGGCSALVMIFSPLYGERSSLYLVFYLIVVSVLVLNDINFTKKIKTALFFLLLIIVCYRTRDIVKRYKLVEQMNYTRTTEIQYYKDHPDVKEAWFKRYPIDTIHSIDIEQDDTYHMETFKEYFDLPQAADKIFFYYDNGD